MTDRSQPNASESIQPLIGNRETLAPTGLDSTPTGVGPFATLPSQFGRYRVTKVLGYGAMGTVYLAFNPEMDREVALKIPKADLSRDAELWERFQREARATGDLNHSNICGMYEVGEIDGTHFISMQYIQGRPLSAFVSNNQSQRKVAGVIRKLALGLAHAHERGIVHRDLKPANVMIDAKGEPIVMDFGLVRRLGISEDIRATQSGMIVGSPAYMSPEQACAEHEKIGPRTDIYGLGVLFFELLTGSLPFRGPTALVLGQLVVLPPPKPSSLRADVDSGLESLCLKMLEKQLQHRPASMTEVVDTLTEWLKSDRVRASDPNATVMAKEDESLSPATLVVQKEEKADPIEAQKQRVNGLLSTHQYSAALELLNKIVNLRDARFEKLVAWGRERLPEVRVLEQEMREASAPLCATGENLLRNHEYSEAVKVLSSAPVQHRSPQLREMLLQAVVLKEECDELERGIANAIQQRNAAGLPTLINGLLKRQPNNKTTKQLADELRKYGAEKLIARRAGLLRFLNLGGQYIKPKYIAIGIVLVIALLAGVGLVFNNGLWNSSIPVTTDDTDEALFTLRGHTDEVIGVAFSSDGAQLMSVGLDQKLKAWDATSGQQLLTTNTSVGTDGCTAFRSDGNEWATIAGFGSAVQFWDTAKGSLQLNGHTGYILAVAISPDRKRVASASMDQTVKVWDATTGKEEFTLKGHTHYVMTVAISEDGKRLASGDADQMVKVWDLMSGQEAFTLKGHTKAVFRVAFNANGTQLASSDVDQKIKLWDLRTGQATFTLSGLSSNVVSLAFSPDGKHIAAGDGLGFLSLWDVKTGQEIVMLRAHVDYIHDMAFSADGTRLASASSDKTIKVWDVPKGARLSKWNDIVDDTAWHYSAFGSDGKFAKTRGGWLERSTNGSRFYFAEVRRNDKVVELIDRSRSLSIRLYNDHCELSTDRRNWRLLYGGSWRQDKQ